MSFPPQRRDRARPPIGQWEGERAKLTANLLNGLAIATIFACVGAPYIAISLNAPGAPHDWWNLLGLSGFGFVFGIVLHSVARTVLPKDGE